MCLDTSSFETVDIEDFYDPDELSKQNDFSTDLVVLTEREQILYNLFVDRMTEVSPETLTVVSDRLADLERLTRNIAHFPSLLKANSNGAFDHSTEELVDNLVKRLSEGTDRSLYLPAKATLGKGFLVAKFQFFMSLAKIAAESGFSKSQIHEFQLTSTKLMFTLMAEDVYMSILDNVTIPLEIRQETANALIILWEHRSDQNVADMAPVLEAVWNARSRLAPAFGTMVGTSELLLLSIEMDDTWRRFIATQTGDRDVSMALEEFLFGLSYEDIQRVKAVLRDRGISAIGRHEVAAFLDREDELEAAFDDADPRSFYLGYSVRRDNAKARLRMNQPGPHHTLEDHYMKFILEENKEKQQTDVDTE